MRKRSARREALEQAVLLAARRSSTAAVMLHGALAEHFGMSATDMKTLELLDRHGPMSAGDLALRTGLAATSVTSLIDRLEKKGLVRRASDPADRRRVVVEIVADRLAEMGAPYAAIARATVDLVQSYSDAQLRAIEEFLTRGAAQVEEVVAAFSRRDEQPGQRAPRRTSKRPARGATEK